MKRISLLLSLYLLFTISITNPLTAQQLPTPIPDSWMGGGTDTQQFQVLTVGDFAWWSQFRYGSGVIVSQRIVLLSAHQLYEFDRGWAKRLFLIRANHGTIQTTLTYRPEGWGRRRVANRLTIVANYKNFPSSSIDSLNREHAVAQVRSSTPVLYNHYMRMEGARPGGGRFEARSNIDQHVRQLARTATQKSVMCYPGGFYSTLSHPRRWKLHETYPQGHYLFFRRGPAYDGRGWPNGYFATNQIRAAGGCSGGSLQYMRPGSNRTVLGTVVGVFQEGGVHHTTVRLADNRVLRMLARNFTSGF